MLATELVGIGMAICLVMFTTQTTCAHLPPGPDEPPKISNLDQGLLFQFVSIEMSDGSKVVGQVIGVYNERPFMWHPMNRDTLALFKCGSPELGLDSFKTSPLSKNAVFTINTDEISAIEVVKQPPDSATTYRQYLRDHDIAIHHQTIIEGVEAYILTGWTSYHTWEDGRSNYAWDLSALNDNMMTYSSLGQELTDYAAFGRQLGLPLSGFVSKVMRSHPDNPPDLIAAIQFEALDNGNEADLDEKPNNGVEVTPGGPFLLRILHQKQDSIPANITEGQFLEVGSPIGQVGNSGTTFTPHTHLVFGFFDQNDRFWSTPIEWECYKHRILMGYPTGFEYGDYKFHQYGYPKFQQCVKSCL